MSKKKVNMIVKILVCLRETIILGASNRFMVHIATLGFDAP